jgi:hypothetical protein
MAGDYRGTKSSDAEFMQYRSPVSVGPSAVGAHGFGAHHAMGAVHVFCDGAIHDFLGKAGPAAPCVEFAGRVEQLGIAADAVVGAVGPNAFVLAGVGALGGCMPCDLESDRLRAFVGQQGLPFGVGFLDVGSVG